MIGKDQEWMLTKAEKADTMALKALANGTAADYQQKRALDWILAATCVYDLSYKPSPPFSQTDTVFSEGRRWVGLQILREINLPVERLPGRDKNSEHGT